MSRKNRTTHFDVQRSQFFSVDWKYNNQSFLDNDFIESLIRSVVIEDDSIQIEMMSASNQYFYDVLKIFETMNYVKHFGLNIGFRHTDGTINGGFGFELNGFQFSINDLNCVENTNIVEIMINFGYNNKRILTDEEMDFDDDFSLPDLKKMLVRLNLENV